MINFRQSAVFIALCYAFFAGAFTITLSPAYVQAQTPATAASPASPASAAPDQANQANQARQDPHDLHAIYQADDFYQSRVDMSFSNKAGRITRIEQTYYDLAFDRTGQRLHLVGPQWDMLITADRVQFKTELFPDVYMDATLAQPFGSSTIELLAGIVPPAVNPLLPDLAMLMQQEAQALQLVLGNPTTATHANNTWSASVAGSDHILKVDPQSGRITELVIESTQKEGAIDAQLRTAFVISQTSTGQVLPESAFAFDTAGMIAYPTLQEMVQNSAAAQRHAGANQPGAQAQGIVDQPAPELDLEILDSEGKRFKIADAGDRIVVLDFWASWCNPCRIALPHLQAVNQWVEQEKLPVDIYTINVGETPALARQTMQEINVTLPVLMDPQQMSLPAYGSSVLPTTVIIKDGIVKRVHTGFAPNYEQKMRHDIEQLLPPTPPTSP